VRSRVGAHDHVPLREITVNRNQQLQHVLERARHVPLYRNKLEHHALSESDLSSLGFTTRADLAKVFSEYQHGGFDFKDAALVHLTPAPGGWMPEYLSLNDLEWQAKATAELFKRIGVGRGSRVIVAFGYHVFAGGWLFHEALLQVGATVLPHGPGEAERLAQIAKDHEYDVLVSNPTFALRVAEAGAKFKLLVAAGEAFSSVPGYRERVEAAIGGVAIDVFGMSETGLVASETLDRNGLVPLKDMAILEVIDPVTLEPTPSGEKGELVITTLARELMPLIRFRTGDLTVVERLENGGLRFPRGMIGRTDEMVKVKGVKLYPRELGPILTSVPGLDPRQFQLVISRTQSGTDHLKLQVLGEASADTSKLEPMFRQALGIGMNEVCVVEKLEGGLVIDTRA
jgi:phenylacetate-CoA ligase